MSLLFFIFACMASLAPGRSHVELGTAIARKVLAEPPLFRHDEDKIRTASYLIAVAFREGSLHPGIIGDHGHSFCTFQIHDSSGGTEALAKDPNACVDKAFTMLKESMAMCPAHPLAFYASGPGGCDNERAQRISRDRLAIAARLAKTASE